MAASSECASRRFVRPVVLRCDVNIHEAPVGHRHAIVELLAVAIPLASRWVLRLDPASRCATRASESESRGNQSAAATKHAWDRGTICRARA